MAGRPSKSRVLDVWMNGERVGNWTLQAQGHRFSYAETWLASPNVRPLSLSLPLSQGVAPFSGDRVENYFDNLLPDSIGIRKRLANRFGAVSTRPFDLIEKLGRDCVGAVQLMPDGAAPPDVHQISAEPLSETGVAQLLDETLAAPAPGGLEDSHHLRISLAGAQEKTALLLHEGQWCVPRGATPTTHILKLPLGQVGRARADFSTSVENEWLCSRLASAFGLKVAASRIECFGRHKVLVVERFDRTLLGDWWARLPQEDSALECDREGQRGRQRFRGDVGSVLDTGAPSGRRRAGAVAPKFSGAGERPNFRRRAEAGRAASFRVMAMPTA